LLPPDPPEDDEPDPEPLDPDPPEDDDPAEPVFAFGVALDALLLSLAPELEPESDPELDPEEPPSLLLPPFDAPPSLLPSLRFDPDPLLP
jgi:hypothetical protein